MANGDPERPTASDFLNPEVEGLAWWQLRPRHLRGLVRWRHLAGTIITSAVVWFFVGINAVINGIIGAFEFAVFGLMGGMQDITQAIANAAIVPFLASLGVAQASIIGTGLAGAGVGFAAALGVLLAANFFIDLFWRSG